MELNYLAAYLTAVIGRKKGATQFRRTLERLMKELLRRSAFLRGLVGSARQIPSDVRRVRAGLRRGAIIDRYLESHTVRKLQIGAGPNELPGWLNADFEPRCPSTIYMDATQPFPLPGGSFDFIFSEHMIEHVPFEQGMKMLAECYRVLRPGGKVRVATPNLEQIAALARSNPSEEQKRYVSWAMTNHVEHAVESQSGDGYRPAYVINNFFWGFGHYFVYDPTTLSDAMRAAGFRDIRFFPVGKSDDAALSGLESHAGLIGSEFNEFETMIAQGTKP